MAKKKTPKDHPNLHLLPEWAQKLARDSGRPDVLPVIHKQADAADYLSKGQLEYDPTPIVLDDGTEIHIGGETDHFPDETEGGGDGDNETKPK